MTIVFPLPLAEFWATLRLISCDIQLGASVQQSRTRGGEILTATLGNRMWSVQATVRPLQHSAASAILATLDILQEAGASFMASPWPHCFPASDPGGTILSGFAPKLNAVAANNYELSLRDMPPGLDLPTGTMLSFPYGASPVRQAFHRIRKGGTAGPTGTTPLMEVSPHVRPGAVVGTAVTLAHPAFKAVIVPDSVSVGTMRCNYREGISFSAIQTLGG